MRSRAAILLALYSAAVVYLTLFPWSFQVFPRGQQIDWVPITGRRMVLDAYLNILLFIPMGALACTTLGPRLWNSVAAAAMCSGIAYLIEWLQLWSTQRYANLNDWVANTAGAAVGSVAAWWLLREGANRRWLALATRWRLTKEQGLLGLLWTLAQAAPFVPAIRLALVKQFLTLGAWSWEPFGDTFVAAMALRAALGRSPWVLLLLCLLPAQAFLLDRQLSWPVVIGGIAGMLFGAGLGRVSEETRRRALQALLVGWLVVKELQPFHFSSTAQPIAWWPFASWYDFGSTGYYPILFRKLFLYTAAVWSLRPAHSQAGISRWLAAASVPAMILAAGEWTQRYLPGRTPESTDVVLACAGAVLLALCDSGPARPGPSGG